MGTTWSVRFAAPAEVVLADIEAAILVRLETILAEMSHWRADSLISAYNRAEAGSWHELPADFYLCTIRLMEI